MKNGQFTDSEIQLIKKKCMTRFSMLLVIKKIHNETTVRCLFAQNILPAGEKEA